jgi:hypothetical protein
MMAGRPRWAPGCGAFTQEGSSLVFFAGVLPVCAWRCSLVYVAPTSPISPLTLKGGAGVVGVTPHRSLSFIDLRRAR